MIKPSPDSIRSLNLKDWSNVVELVTTLTHHALLLFEATDLTTRGKSIGTNLLKVRET